jgi:hypothetical protein
MDQIPTVVVEMTFLRPEEGGRVQVPGPPFKDYSPHLVVQSPDVRQAIVKDRFIVEDYLGVRFLSGPSEYEAGQSGIFHLLLMYSPLTLYDALRPGVTFTVREGARIIGFGTVIERPEA